LITLFPDPPVTPLSNPLQRKLANTLDRQDALFLRFLAVGAINAAFGYGVFAALLYVGSHYAMASFISTVVGVLFNFKTTGRLVFGSHDNRLIFRFVGTYVIIYLANVAGLKLFSLFGIHPYLGGALLVLPLAVLAFTLNKRFVFHHGQANQHRNSLF
jgi:putative flippase GtrA